jgi:general secretion pathway protein E
MADNLVSKPSPGGTGASDADPVDGAAHLALLEAAVARRVTDIHIDPLLEGYQIRMRVDGMLTPLRTETGEGGHRLINQFKAAAGIDPGAVFTPLGIRRKFDVAGSRIDCRLTLAPCVSGPKLSIRLLDPKRVLRSIDELGLGEPDLERIGRWLRELNGMFLVCGPTASGKTTTLYTLLHAMAVENRHIVTIEDPVEYEIDGINQIQVDRRHGLGFAEGIRTILRLDPDLAMVGELRSPAGADAAVSAAVAGHVILTTMHSRDAVSSVTALRNFQIADHRIAAALGVVVNQRLVRKLCAACRKESALPPAECEFLKSHGIDPPARAWKPAGCEACNHTGFLGRTGLFEIWDADEADYEMILAGADEESIRKKLERQGHRTIWHDAAGKIGLGVTTFGEVQRLGLALPWDQPGAAG